MGNGKNSTVSWFFPAVVGALVALIGSGGTYYLTNWKNTREHTRGVTTVRAQIIESAIGKDNNLIAARLTLDYVLEPIDETGEFEEFSKKIMELFAEQAPQTSVGPERDSLSNVTPTISGEIFDLIGKLAGSERLSASNALVTRAKTDQVAVVDALVDSLKNEEIYRIALYVVFTLARIPGGWHGTEDQLAEVKSLRESTNYGDKTFEKRTEEAISNWKKRM